MRLRRLENEHAPIARLFLRVLSAVSRRPAPDVLKMHLYRPQFFGRSFASLTQNVMRGPSTWSVGERELFAAYTSKLNQCPF